MLAPSLAAGGFQKTKLDFVGAGVVGGEDFVYIDPLGGIVAGVTGGTVAGNLADAFAGIGASAAGMQ